MHRVFGWTKKTPLPPRIFPPFCYEIAEISINSLFINYATSDGWMDKAAASVVLSFGALGLFMAARVGGSWIMSKVAAEKVLFVCAVMTVAGAVAVTMDAGWVSKAGLFACYAFEAIMFPTIFALTIVNAGKSVKMASSFLMMTPIGGAVGTFLMGLTADHTSMSFAFIVPAIAYGVVLIFASSILKSKNEYDQHRQPMRRHLLHRTYNPRPSDNPQVYRTHARRDRLLFRQGIKEP